MKLLGRTALVTGAARGIGRAALELARAGADVAVNDRERTPQAEAAVAEIQALGRQRCWSKATCFIARRARASLQRAIAALGRIDILSATRHSSAVLISSSTIRRRSPG